MSETQRLTTALDGRYRIERQLGAGVHLLLHWFDPTAAFTRRTMTD